MNKYVKNLLSIVIPSYRDPLLKKTIEDLLEKAEDEVEVIAVLDGYWVGGDDIVEDERVNYVHLGKNRGMRGAINAGVDVAKGEYLMRVDEHQIFGQGYDKILTENCEDNWIITPRRFFLDVDKWEIMDMKPVDYMELKIGKTATGEKFSGVEKPGDNKQMIQESMAMQGSCWVMPHKWWDEVIGELQTEGYGPLYQDSHEMVFKTWKAGGKLMVDKNTWHAHKHRSFPRTHNNGTKENPSNNDQCFAYSIKVWKDYFEREIKRKWKK